MYLKRNNKLEIMALYRRGYKKSLYLREISKLTKIPLKTTQSSLAILEKDSILKSCINGKNKYFELNMNNIQTKLILIESEIYETMLFLNRYHQFKTFLKSLSSSTPLIIFGSFAMLSPDKSSDVDLLVISEKEPKNLPFHLVPNKIHQIVLSEHSFVKALEKQEILIKEIEENHIILNNHSFYVDSMWRYYGK